MSATRRQVNAVSACRITVHRTGVPTTTQASSGNAFLAVLDAANLATGPVAKAHLEHHTPLSFHGYWQART